LPSNKRKEGSCPQFYQWILCGYPAPAAAAPASLQKVAQHRYELVPSKLFAAGKTPRAPRQGPPRVVAEHQHIKEAPYDSAKNKKNHKR